MGEAEAKKKKLTDLSEILKTEPNTELTEGTDPKKYSKKQQKGTDSALRSFKDQSTNVNVILFITI